MLLLILFLILFPIVILIFYYNRDNFTNNNCACVFDIDGTITCSKDNAREAIDTCRKNSCILAINTARTGPYLNDVSMSELGLNINDIKDDFYHGESTDNNFDNNSIAQVKVKHLNTIQNKYNLTKKRTILFDDNNFNIDLAAKAGFTTIHANNPMCGLSKDVSSVINKVLEN